ncbi:hypothetical protein F5B19DRAFT_343484 [Rostrohypoxylon terebratum]|nr:hypothetical protein F5B19DRAFT_343484 [Rostrohypoxylon terebratum]
METGLSIEPSSIVCLFACFSCFCKFIMSKGCYGQAVSNTACLGSLLLKAASHHCHHHRSSHQYHRRFPFRSCGFPPTGVPDVPMNGVERGRGDIRDGGSFFFLLCISVTAELLFPSGFPLGGLGLRARSLLCFGRYL